MRRAEARRSRRPEGSGGTRKELMLLRYFLKMERLGLLHLGQRAHFGEHVGGQFAIDFDQCDRVAAGRCPMPARVED